MYGLRIVVNNAIEVLRPVLERRWKQYVDKENFENADGHMSLASPHGSRPSRDNSEGVNVHASRPSRPELVDDVDDLLSERSYVDYARRGDPRSRNPKFRSVEWETGAGPIVREKLIDRRQRSPLKLALVTSCCHFSSSSFFGSTQSLQAYTFIYTYTHFTSR